MRQKGAPKSVANEGATANRYSLLADGIAGTGTCQNIKCSKSDASLSFGVCQLKEGKKKTLTLCSDCRILANSKKFCVGCEEFYHDKEAGLWVQCTEDTCKQWSHILCVSSGAIGKKNFICLVCETKQTVGKDINLNLVKAAKKSMTKLSLNLKSPNGQGPKPSDSVSVKRKAEGTDEDSAKKPKLVEGETVAPKSPVLANVPCEMPLCTNRSAINTLRIRNAKKMVVCDSCLRHVDDRLWCPVCFQVYLKDDTKAWIGCEHRKCRGWVHAECAKVSMDVTEVDCPHCGKCIPISEEDKRTILTPTEQTLKSKAHSNTKVPNADPPAASPKVATAQAPKASAGRSIDPAKLKKLKEIENQELEAVSKSLFEGQAPASRRSNRLAENSDWMLARRIQEKEMSRAFTARPVVASVIPATSRAANGKGTTGSSKGPDTKEPPSQNVVAAKAPKSARKDAAVESKVFKKEEESGSGKYGSAAGTSKPETKAPLGNTDNSTLAFDCLLDSSESAGGLRALDKKKIRTAVKACAKDVRNFLIKKLKLPNNTQVDILYNGRLLSNNERLKSLAPMGEKLVVTYRSSKQ